MSGRIFKHKCEPILSEVAPIVQQQILDELHKSYSDIICLPLGSVGKKPVNEYNGDIDIAVKCKTIKQLEEIISNVFYYLDKVTIESYYIVSIAFPYQITGEEKIRYVQCDFILMWDESYTNFRYYCPNYIKNESEYKTGAKIMLANMILNHVPARYDNVPDNMGAKFDFRPTALYRYIYDFKNRKYTEEFITQKVDSIVRMCFTDGDASHFNTVETLWDAIHSDIFISPNETRTIERNWFVNCWKKGWTSIVPERFSLQYWTNDEIWEEIKKQDMVNKINQIFKSNNEI